MPLTHCSVFHSCMMSWKRYGCVCVCKCVYMCETMIKINQKAADRREWETCLNRRYQTHNGKEKICWKLRRMRINQWRKMSESDLSDEKWKFTKLKLCIWIWRNHQSPYPTNETMPIRRLIIPIEYDICSI